MGCCMFTVAIIGRPNVGKSTLFNKLIGKRIAIVNDVPGVTRDRREGLAQLFDTEFMIVDTAGLEKESTKDLMLKSMITQTNYAINNSDVVFFVIDAKHGVTAEDLLFAKKIRKKHHNILLIVNKSENLNEPLYEIPKLGLGDPIYISAEHNNGFSDLYEAMFNIIEFYKAQVDTLTSERDTEEDMQITIIGRPNAGKSTLTNRLLGEERVITGSTPGLTRDSIYTTIQYNDTNITLVDTAGIRKRAFSQDKLEKTSVINAMQSIKYSHVVILMVDASIALEHQDISLLQYVVNEGRAIVVAINKWDTIINKHLYVSWLEQQIEKKFPNISGVPVVPISALKGTNCNILLESCFEMYEIWNKRIPTSKLNKWIQKAIENFPPNLSKNKRRIRIKYVTQINTRPPTFIFHMNNPEDLEGTYVRYLMKEIRYEFGMMGVPIRILTKKIKNPYLVK